ncbi:DNA-directed RNA polymerase II subunit RPB1 [Eurytemora carolleeae]|uniref:DNA-directed RNA polymerase II subunit RPB1 n=1 Tax=Eurytemora carolleeae TaxID=1294199 RepID=UPI000C76D21F|nr:DNA-directed RNA polymerase II subunit RPB1 [Eurytemora carolleeae]|eukprot:XP_023330146.1 DNA-directed RNA polymerase II subunit RPB1-like [Eurytemora affinis]
MNVCSSRFAAVVILCTNLVFTIPTVPDFLNFANAALPAQQSAGIDPAALAPNPVDGISNRPGFISVSSNNLPVIPNQRNISAQSQGQPVLAQQVSVQPTLMNETLISNTSSLHGKLPSGLNVSTMQSVNYVPVSAAVVAAKSSVSAAQVVPASAAAPPVSLRALAASPIVPLDISQKSAIVSPKEQPSAVAVSPVLSGVSSATPKVPPASLKVPSAAPLVPQVSPDASPEVSSALPAVPQASPEVSSASPEVPSASPQAPLASPEVPSASPEVLPGSPEVLPASPEVLPASPEVPSASPELPPASPEVPPASPEVLGASPEVPLASPELPPASPEIPPASPEVPQASSDASPAYPVAHPASLAAPPAASPPVPLTSPESPPVSSQPPSGFPSVPVVSSAVPSASPASPQTIPVSQGESLILPLANSDAPAVVSPVFPNIQVESKALALPAGSSVVPVNPSLPGFVPKAQVNPDDTQISPIGKSGPLPGPPILQPITPLAPSFLQSNSSRINASLSRTNQSLISTDDNQNNIGWEAANTTQANESSGLPIQETFPPNNGSILNGEPRLSDSDELNHSLPSFKLNNNTSKEPAAVIVDQDPYTANQSLPLTLNLPEAELHTNQPDGLDTSMNVELEDGIQEEGYQDRLAQKAELRSQILSLLDDLDKAIPENI